MSNTKIITTIGPSSLNLETLTYFKNHSVEFARLNFSHSASEWHIEAGQKCREAGLKLLVDLGGPKIRLGVLHQDTEIQSGEKIILETANPDISYPFNKDSRLVLPVAVDLSKAVKADSQILIDDGKLRLLVEKVENSQVYCIVEAGGIFRSRKGVNLPKTSLEISFLTDRDRQMLVDTLATLKPEVVACSFVKSKADIDEIKNYLKTIIKDQNIDSDYFPQICGKLEQHELFLDNNLEQVVDACDILMIARGDLALEVTPAHLILPFLQEKIERVCRTKNKPFVVATQILETMISCPVPTRAEVSDLYRAVLVDKADYIMLSGESAMGQYPRQCIELMDAMIKDGERLQAEILA
jgi:pyruvate kinase